jgi:hypothetical protein
MEFKKKTTYGLPRDIKNYLNQVCSSSNLFIEKSYDDYTMGGNEKTKNMLVVCENLRISPAHKRTEGRATVWGSEPTTKVASLQGGGFG